MKTTTALRIISENIKRQPLKNTYWDIRKLIDNTLFLIHKSDPNYKKHYRNDLTSYLLNNTTPIQEQTAERIKAGVQWILHAQSVNNDNGVSLGYFPTNLEYKGWLPSYPETTGYIITTLLSYARTFNDDAARDAAIKMGLWEIDVQMASGAVQGGPVTTADKQTPAAFNTGMTLDGWCSVYEETQNEAFFNAAKKAADFLYNDLDENGYFKTNGHYVTDGEIKTYTCLCAWALYRFGVLANEDKYKEAAVRSIEAAIAQQNDAGWYAHNCLSISKSPLTHTIGYTLQGVLEVGLLAGRQDFIDSVIKGVEAIIPNIKNGYLSGRFFSDWTSANFSCCLTGSAQIAIVCYRLALHTGNALYTQKANELVNFLKNRQVIDLTTPDIHGAMGGSFPLAGAYMSTGYPNWATKYYIDALLLQYQHK